MTDQRNREQVIKEDFKGLDFGSYCWIEMNRYGSPNEFYQHKVVGGLHSSHAAKVPIAHGPGATGTEPVPIGVNKTTVPVISVICCGLAEDEVYRVAVSDVHSKFPQELAKAQRESTWNRRK